MCKMQHPNHILMVIKVQERLISDILRHNRRTKIELAHEQMGHFRKISAELPETQFRERWEDYIGCSIHAAFFFIFKLFFNGRFPIAKNKFILHSTQSSGILLWRPLIRHFIPSSGIVVFSAALGATAKVHAGPGSFIDRASSCECSKLKDSRTSNRTVRGEAAHGRGNGRCLPQPPSYQGTFMLFSSPEQRETQEKNIRTHLQ